MNTVAIINYGMGNLHSVAKALEKVGDNARIIVSADAATILKADRVVLPGVGAIRDCIGEIRRLGLDQVIHEVAMTKPLLGICVGMQTLMEFSEENGGTQCLGILPGRVVGMSKHVPKQGISFKVPHMGWNQVHQTTDSVLWQNIPQDARFYFVHSYYVEPEVSEMVVASTTYLVPFASVVARDNIFAVQFHPEKSQQVGLQLYANFLNWAG